MRDVVIERLCDPAVIPLHIVCDIVMGEMAQYADYFVPDVSQFESFGLPHGEPLRLCGALRGRDPAGDPLG